MIDPIGNVWRKIEIESWQIWFAWRPVNTVSGERVWFKKIYRRTTWYFGGDVDGKWAKYEYGNLFDILKQ